MAVAVGLTAARAGSNLVAPSSYDRWLVPPAALAIHLCIGMAYGFSVFWLPLSRALGGAAPRTCDATVSIPAELFTTACDWRISTMGWMYTLFFVFLGSSAALFGGWLERAGPRRAGLVSAACWCGGLCISALGVRLHQLWLLWLGSGVIGGIGLGLGYISPVSTLIKWFPDRRGMATGMAIMGFGGGALVGAPLADRLMKRFATPGSPGVAETFLALAAIYFVFMVGGALGYRVPPPGWRPAGPTVRAGSTNSGSRHVPASRVFGIRQFWLLWLVLLLNVSAGIGIVGMASPLLQEVFGGRLIGIDAPLARLDAAGQKATASAGAAFTGLLSLFNIAGRFAWASLSDRIGRRTTYAIFFLLGGALYASIPSLARAGSLPLFVAACCLILTMYGGGFATIPAYLADLFGTQMVGAIHGRLLTAWSTAGILGPVLVNYIREYQLARGTGSAEAYNVTMYLLGGLLAVGFVVNLLVRPVEDRHFTTAAPPGPLAAAAIPVGIEAGPVRRNPALLCAAWIAVCAPLGWGVFVTLQKAAGLLR